MIKESMYRIDEFNMNKMDEIVIMLDFWNVDIVNANEVLCARHVNVTATLCYVPFWYHLGLLLTVTMMPDTAGSYCIIIFIE